MQEGTIARINNEKGYGFISIEGQERDVFFHTSALVGVQLNELHQGDKVTFDVVPPKEPGKGPAAVNVNRV